MNTLSMISAGSARGSFPKFSAEAITDMWADTVVDNAGYADKTDRILARFDNGVERLFPDAEELRARGVDILKLAACIQEDLVVCEHFNDTLKSLSVDELNGALEHLLEASEAYQAHPSDALDRSMHHQRCCSCHAA